MLLFVCKTRALRTGDLWCDLRDVPRKQVLIYNGKTTHYGLDWFQ